MRILFVAPANSVHSFKWINYFNTNGCCTTWLTLHKPNESIVKNYSSLIPVHCLVTPSRIINSFLSFFYLGYLILKHKPNILHAHSVGVYGIVAALYAWIVPFVATTWGSDILVSGKSWWRKPFVKFVLKRACIITCDANHMVDEMKAIGITASKIKIINFGINTEVLRKLPNNDDEYTNKFKGVDNRPVVISLRNHYPVYDIKTLINAAKSVVLEHNKINFIIAGNGPLTTELKKLVNEYGLGKHIDFIGSYDGSALSKIFSACDVYVSTSLSDAGIAASTAEAMSCEIPVIISDTGENNRWIENGINGYLFEAGNDKQLANLISMLITNKELCDKIGSEGRKTIIERNDYNNEMQKMRKLYDSIIGCNNATRA